MKFLLTALGSYGDVHPMVGLGAALKARGHHVAIVTNPHFQPMVERMGIEFLAFGTAEQYHELAHDPHLFHPMKGPPLILGHMARTVRELYRIIDTNVVPGETTLGAHVLDYASRTHHELRGTPMASIHFAPVGLRSFYESPQMFRMLMQPWLPMWFRRLQYWMADKVVDHILAGEINSLRRDLGLLPVHRVMHEWYFSPQLVLGLFPRWFAPPQPDWPANTKLTGFPLWDESVTTTLSPKVIEFLEGGEKPVVCAPGSANTDARFFFEAAVEACTSLKRRAILLSRYKDHVPRDLPEYVIHAEFVPFSHLLPRCAAMVHHGGVGTSAQGLSAGVPHIVMPLAFDQLDNAARLSRLGVAKTLSPTKFTGRNLTRVLGALLDDRRIDESAKHWAAVMRTHDPLTETCVELETLGINSERKRHSTR